MQAAFNPKKPGPMAVLSSQGNFDYFTQRAVECISDARAMSDPTLELTKAIQCLVLARINYDEACSQNQSNGSQNTR